MWRLDELAKMVGGQIVGATDWVVEGAGAINRAQNNQITLVTNKDYLEQFENSPASVAIVPLNLVSLNKPCIQVDCPESAFAQIVALFRPQTERCHSGISPRAIVSETAVLGENVCVHPGAVIMDHVTIGEGSIIFPNVTIMENCRIGANVTVFPGAVLYDNTEVGDRCLIHANVVIGAYGFGYSTSNGAHHLGPQLGNVRIESDVEIGANTTIDRGTYDSTVIGSGTKLDNLVMIGHNCQIGANNLLCSQVGIAGSCETGDYVVMGGQVGLADHLKVGARAVVAAQSGVMHDIEAETQVFGSPARPLREEMQILANRARLPEMRRSLRDLERQIQSLQKQLDDSRAESTSTPSSDETRRLEEFSRVRVA